MSTDALFHAEPVLRLSFECAGEPLPKGSMRAFVNRRTGRAVVTSDNPRSREWQRSVETAAMVARAGAQPLSGAVHVQAHFYLTRPASLPRKVGHPIKRRADVDKLARVLLDALTRAGVFHDDAQVVTLVAHKAFAEGALPARVVVRVFEEPA